MLLDHVERDLAQQPLVLVAQHVILAGQHVVGNLARCEQQVHLLGAEGVGLDRAQVDVQRLVDSWMIGLSGCG